MNAPRWQAGSPCSIIAYHGTNRRFDQFRRHAPAASGSPTRELGTFFSEAPRVAAHFALRPEVINEAYLDPQGSGCLLDDPWQLDSDPFLPHAQVVRARLGFARPAWVNPLDFAQWVEGLRHLPASIAGVQVAAWREQLLQDGHDGIGMRAHAALCVEYAGVTWIALDLATIQIQGRLWVEDLWSVPA